MCFQQLSVLHWMNNLLISKTCFTEFYKPVEVTYLLIRYNKIVFFLWNMVNTDRNGVNKQTTPTYTHTHTHTNTKNSEKENTEKG